MDVKLSNVLLMIKESEMTEYITDSWLWSITGLKVTSMCERKSLSSSVILAAVSITETLPDSSMYIKFVLVLPNESNTILGGKFITSNINTISTGLLFCVPSLAITVTTL